MAKGYSHLKYEDRLKIEALLEEKHSVSEIAECLGCSRSTIYREIERGMGIDEQIIRNVFGKSISTKYNPPSYSADIAQEDYDLNVEGKGAPLKINDELAEYISYCILEQGLSPEQIIDLIKSGNTSFPVNAVLSTRTIYSVIDKGIIPNVTREKMSMLRKIKMFNDGQIIIPKWLRALLELHDGDTFSIEYNKEKQEISLKKDIEQS